jgi:hypothetical protein
VGGRRRGTQILEVVQKHGAQLVGVGGDQRVIEVAVFAGERAQL